jgi:pimeloyl-ACP methyl ester carboxylesterase
VPPLYLYARTAEAELQGPEDDPASSLMNRIDTEQVTQALDALPTEYRVVATLCFSGDFSYQQIAEVAGVPVGTVSGCPDPLTPLATGRAILSSHATSRSPRQTTPVKRSTLWLWAIRTAMGTVGRVAPGVAARWAETIFCTPPRHEPRNAEEEFIATGRGFAVRWEQERLAAWEWGNGPTVVLVHGWGSRAGRLAPMARALVERGFRVVLYDAPAHGVSTGRFASLPEFARALRAVGGAVGPLYGVVGHSLGGAAISLALHDGLAVERAVLIAPPSDVVVFSQAFAQYVRLPARAHNAMRRNLEARLRMRWDDIHIPKLARQLRIPVLLVHDRDDTDVPYLHAEEIAGSWPGARLLPTSGLGHRAILRDPAVVRAAVEFLREGVRG